MTARRGPAAYLRLRVVGGGCSGFQHKLDLDPEVKEKTDEVFGKSGAAGNLVVLGVFKYTGFAIENLNALLGFAGIDLPVPQIVTS